MSIPKPEELANVEVRYFHRTYKGHNGRVSSSGLRTCGWPMSWRRAWKLYM